MTAELTSPRIATPGPHDGPNPNRYFVGLWRAPGRAEQPVEWDPWAETSMRDFNGRFWGRVCQQVEQLLPDQGLTVYLTWDLAELPRYGEDVVAIVVGDEWGLTPQYAHRIRRTFKLHGDRPLLERPPAERSRLAALTTVRYARSRAKRLTGDLRDTARAWSNRPAASRTRILRLPVGYSNSLDLTLRPFDGRNIDVNFAGSVHNKAYSRRDPAYWMGTPKEHARALMLDGLERWSRRRPEARVHLRVTESYAASMADDPADYSTHLMNSRISLAPRGTTIETYRVFEGLRYGCVVLTDPLPETWYLSGAPVVEVADWSRLPELLDELLADPARLQRLHEAALHFYAHRCSETAVGSYIAAALV